jgi:hypothetical protein
MKPPCFPFLVPEPVEAHTSSDNPCTNVWLFDKLLILLLGVSTTDVSSLVIFNVREGRQNAAARIYVAGC